MVLDKVRNICFLNIFLKFEPKGYSGKLELQYKINRRVKKKEKFGAWATKKMKLPLTSKSKL